MRTALLVFIVAGWLLAHTGSSSALQVQSDIARTLADIQKTQVDIAKADLRFGRQNESRTLGWRGGRDPASWSRLEILGTEGACRISAGYATYPGFGQWEMEALARRVVEELRRDEVARQTPKVKA